jgi:hypothetical protein
VIFWQFNGVAGFLTRDVSVLIRGNTVIMSGKETIIVRVKKSATVVREEPSL